MSRGIEFDTSEITTLALDLSRAPGRMQRRSAKAFLVAANKIKRGMRSDARGHDFLRPLPRSVNYDRRGMLEYEIGFDKEGQGNLANIIVFGSVNNAPVFDHTAALRRERPRLVLALAGDAERSVLGGRRGR